MIEGKPEVARTALVVLLAEGHLLIEDVPGVGKTMLSKALARSIDLTVRRIQFTPDLLPSDVTGVSIFNQDTRDFEFRPGGVFANIVIGDEINRASPKTQSAMLECMEERQVTVDNQTFALDTPFMVIATQNPLEMEGTYALPEAQRDRFMARVSMGYPVRPPRSRCCPRARPTARSTTSSRSPTPPRSASSISVRRRRARRPGPSSATPWRSRTGDPALPRAAARRLAAGDAAPGAGREGLRPRWPGATTSSPTTSAHSRRRCWPTGCCRPSRRR